ncbi:MAG: sugar phosphate isomerase/epimerase family protein [Acidobacteriaceae bacterium]
MDSTRRNFLKHSAAISFVASCPYVSSLAATSGPHLQFPTRPVDRLALTSYPFRAYMEGPENPSRDRSKPGMDVLQFAKMAIQKFNIRNINPLLAHFSSTDLEDLPKLRKGVEGAGSRFVGLGLGGGKFYDPDPVVRNASVESSQKSIDIAKILGSPSVRQHLGGTKGVKPEVGRAAESLGKLADYGARKNIVVNLENDSLANEDPFFIGKIIEKVNNPYLCALPDMGNTMRGGDASYNYRGLRVMYSHAFNMSHVKDGVFSPTGKVEKVDLAKTFGIANASGYRGYFSMEWETKLGDPFEGTRKLIQESLKYIS